MTASLRFITALFVVLFVTEALPQSVSQLYDQAKSAEASGKRDVAFLLYRQIVRQYQDTPYVEDSLFQIGQYYYDSCNYFDADQTFRSHLRRFPNSRFHKEIQDYVAKINLRSLKDRADTLFEEGKLGPASVLYEQYLQIDPENSEVKVRLEQISKTMKQVHFGFEQLERERKEFEIEKTELNRRVQQLEDQRKQVLVLQKQAEELNQVTTEKYEKQLGDITGRLQALDQELVRLQNDVMEWRQRAVILDAMKLCQPFPAEFKPTLEDRFLPRIIFGGAAKDLHAEQGEAQIPGILREGFPVVVLTSSKLDAKKNLRHIEAVIGAELTSQWPEGAKLKFRVDIAGKEGQPQPDPIVRYYDAFDMDEIDTSARRYKKRVVFTAEEDKMAKYEVAAFLVKSQ